jgi:magnesium transporter
VSALADPEPIFPQELRDAWPALSRSERVESFKLVAHATADDFFSSLSSAEQADLIASMAPGERRTWMRLLAPDDAADVVQSVAPELRDELLSELDEMTRKEVQALMAYREDVAGGLMNPRFVRVRPEMSIEEALSYVRRQTNDAANNIYYCYVLDQEQRLLGVASLRQLFSASPGSKVSGVMKQDLVAVQENAPQETLSLLFTEHKLLAIPVIGDDQRMKGVVTVDDIVDVVQEEATEDMQKIGGMEALDAPYLNIAFSRMMKKRAGWLAALFLGEMLTATAMAFFEDEIARAVVLALFVPLIISSGGNSGSQASTLVIRAMALGEVRIRDWWRVMRRELGAGITLGLILGSIGFLRIVVWQVFRPTYGAHYLLVAFTVLGSLIGVVMFGTLAGSLLPFVLRRAGFDPASASAPFVATLVDVTGLVIYFSVASVLLRGTLL